MGNKVLIVGGGIAALSLVYLLKSKGNVELFVFEKEEKGGKIQTEYFDYQDKSYFIELGPDSIIFDHKKIEKIEEFFPSLLANKNFANYNPTYVFFKDYYSILPTNTWEFFSTKLLSFTEKFETIYYFLRRFLVNKKNNHILSRKADLNDIFGVSFVNKVIEPLFENIFGLPLSEIDFNVIYPFIKKLERSLFYSSTVLFNHPKGLKSLIEYFSVDIVKDDVKKVDFKNGKFIVNDYFVCDKLVFTCEAYKVSEILKTLLESLDNEVLKSLLVKLFDLLDKIKYRSSYVNVFVLKNFIKFRANGIVFKDSLFLFKSISFFSKKWYKRSELEVIRVFSESKDFDNIYQDLKKFFSMIGYSFDDNILKHYEKYWHKALVNYDVYYSQFIRDLRGIVKELEGYNIFVWGGFLQSSNIVDRIIFSIDNYCRVLGN